GLVHDDDVLVLVQDAHPGDPLGDGRGRHGRRRQLDLQPGAGVQPLGLGGHRGAVQQDVAGGDDLGRAAPRQPEQPRERRVDAFALQAVGDGEAPHLPHQGFSSGAGTLSTPSASPAAAGPPVLRVLPAPFSGSPGSSAVSRAAGSSGSAPGSSSSLPGSRVPLICRPRAASRTARTPPQTIDESARLNTGKFGTWIQSTTWPFSGAGARSIRSTRLPTAPPSSSPRQIAQGRLRRLRAVRRIATTTPIAISVKTTV